MPEQMELGTVGYYKEIDEAVAGMKSKANPDWLREFTRALLVSAMDNETLDVSTVWATLKRLGSPVTTSNKMAAGAVMRLGVSKGWIEQIERPAGVICKSNHNSRGTSYYRSLLYGQN